jgi:hypothetical protein
MQLNEQSTTPKKEAKPFVAWESQERVRPPWVAQKHSERVLPQMDQKSNNDIATNLVLQPRDEKIGVNSQATPITGRHGTGNGASDEPSGSNRSYSDSGGTAL